MTAVKYTDLPQFLDKQSRLQFDEEKLKQDIRRLLLTAPGEFIGQPEYGTNIKNYIYEPLTDGTATFIEMDVRKAFSQWLPDTVILEGLKVRIDVDSHTLSVDLSIYLQDFDRQVLFNLPLTE